MASLPGSVSPAALAEPPNSLFSSRRMIFCASSVLPVATSVLICFICACVNGHADAAKGADALDRIVQRLAQLHR